ncbi:polysaccharide deacetylase family protein [Prosthecomicrobium pneumaticum]|uniref:Chitooligosaccharide deacetylase n=1 Tax=Prosthecomicrobium pneumaticum TaxID=81895 RepID=A0A7W9CUD2_9HYPH|nr:polysaccharide deacetylase family protein [Prosthecomicrobium pneumaticum]MBB5751547.1 peptidoglycan/xylan/chitin deacetylase (PgdA/CDA1 family) [Prosthecomicrobium pneumaticum]
MTQPDTHPRDFVGYGGTPPDPRWPGGARLALNLVVNVEEGSEPSIPDGDPASESGLTEGGGGGFEGRDLAAESMFEYGGRAGFWRLHRAFGTRGMTATMFACALALERNPAIAGAIRESGYDVCCHGYRWERVQPLGEARERALVARAVASVAATLGTPPAGWYCRYGPSLATRRILVEHGGFLYDSDSYADDLPYYADVGGRPHLVLPYSLANNDVKFVRGGMSTGRQFAEFLIDAFDVLHREGAHAPKMMSVGLHPRIVGHPARFAGLERFLDHVARQTGVWVARRLDIARHWRAGHPPA